MGQSSLVWTAVGIGFTYFVFIVLGNQIRSIAAVGGAVALAILLFAFAYTGRQVWQDWRWRRELARLRRD